MIFADFHQWNKVAHRDWYVLSENAVFFIQAFCFFNPLGNDIFQSRLIFCWHLFSFFSHEISKLHQTIAAKFCNMMGSVFNSIIPVQNFGGSSLRPKKYRDQKHAKFGPISDDFDDAYFQNRWRYSKLDRYLIYCDSSRVRQKKSGELLKCGGEIIPTQINLFGRPYFRPKGCCTPKILHAVENDQVLLAHTPPRMRVSYNFFQRRLKLAKNSPNVCLYICG